jgi:four helix bundle protein
LVELFRGFLRFELTVFALSVVAFRAATRAFVHRSSFRITLGLWTPPASEDAGLPEVAVHANAHALAVEVRSAIKRFPRTGYASLKAQMTSAAESISFNIVEGCGADSQREFARFLDVAIRSAMELENQLTLARDYGILHTRDWEAVHEATVDVRRMLYGLRKKVRAAIPGASVVTQQRTTQKRSTQNAKGSQ